MIKSDFKISYIPWMNLVLKDKTTWNSDDTPPTLNGVFSGNWSLKKIGERMWYRDTTKKTDTIKYNEDLKIFEYDN